MRTTMNKVATATWLILMVMGTTTTTGAGLMGCVAALDVEADEDEPIDTRDNEIFQGVYDCSERNDRGYQNGNSFAIKVVSVDARPVEIETANAYIAMQARARSQGVNLRIVSGFRTNAEQQHLYGCYVNCNCNNCNLAARPGYSNHQSGHALDLNTGDSGVLTWLNNNGRSFGFSRTVPSETWHWEYWGAVDFSGPCGRPPPPPPTPCNTGNYDGSFCDDEGSSSESAHDRLRGELGVNFHCANVDGSPAFCGGRDATRGETIFVLGRAADVPLSGHPDAFDDDDGHTYERDFNAAKAYGIVLGASGTGNASPNGVASRSTVGVILRRMYLLPPADRDYFDDDDGSSQEDTHNRVAAAGLILGYSDSDGGRKDYRGSDPITRSGLAIIASRAATRGLVPVWNIPEGCRGGPFDGHFCDDEGSANETLNDHLADDLDVPGLECVRAGPGQTGFCGTEAATRGLALAIFGAATGIPMAGHDDAFDDDDGHLYEDAINAAFAYGVIRGANGGTEALPDGLCSRDTAGIMLDRLFALPSSDVDAFTDDDGSSNESRHNRLAAAGIFAGSSDSNGGRTFDGGDVMRRQDVVTVIRRALEAGLLPVWTQEPPGGPGAGGGGPVDDPDDVEDPAPPDGPDGGGDDGDGDDGDDGDIPDDGVTDIDEEVPPEGDGGSATVDDAPLPPSVRSFGCAAGGGARGGVAVLAGAALILAAGRRRRR